METIVVRVFPDFWFLPCQGSASNQLRYAPISIFKHLQYRRARRLGRWADKDFATRLWATPVLAQ